MGLPRRLPDAPDSSVAKRGGRADAVAGQPSAATSLLVMPAASLPGTSSTGARVLSITGLPKRTRSSTTMRELDRRSGLTQQPVLNMARMADAAPRAPARHAPWLVWLALTDPRAGTRCASRSGEYAGPDLLVVALDHPANPQESREHPARAGTGPAVHAALKEMLGRP